MPMRGVVIYCPNGDCRKPLLRDAYLRIGSRASVRCYSCGGVALIVSGEGGISREMIADPKPSLTGKKPEPTMEAEEDSGFAVVET